YSPVRCVSNPTYSWCVERALWFLARPGQQSWPVAAAGKTDSVGAEPGPGPKLACRGGFLGCRRDRFWCFRTRLLDVEISWADQSVDLEWRCKGLGRYG